MAWWNRTPAPAPEPTPAMVPATEVDTLSYRLEQVTEKLADLQREDRGWTALSGVGGDLITREDLGTKTDKLRAAVIMNPLLRRALGVRIGYVWGTGVTISAAEQADGSQDVDAIVQGFLTDERNTAACFSAQAREEAEGDLFADGNHFRAHFVNPLTGHVQVRPIPFTEITEIRTAPGDRYTTHYYLRQWTETQAGTFGVGSYQRKAYYPDIRFQPLTQPKRIGDIPVLWPGTVGGAAIQHVHARTAGRGSVWGIPDAWAAMPYALRYEGFLADWLTLTKTLAKIAWQMKDPNGKSQTLRAEAAALANAPGVGGVAATGTGTLEAIPKTGANVDADSGRPVAAMVAAALDLPVTMLLADPGVTGARATAETLDRPTKDAMRARQLIWEAADRASVQFVIEQHVIAPRGHLKGQVINEDDRMAVHFTDNTDPSIQVVWPSLDEPDTEAVLTALTTADDLGVLPKVELAKLVLHALGVPGVPDLIDQMTDDDGNWVPPDGSPEQSEGNAAANRFRQGQDMDGNPVDQDE